MMREFNELQYFVKHEIDHYDYYSLHEIEIEEEDSKYKYWSVEILLGDDGITYLNFRSSIESEEVLFEVEVAEDCWEKVDYFKSSVKYFWIALLTKN